MNVRNKDLLPSGYRCGLIMAMMPNVHPTILKSIIDIELIVASVVVGKTVSQPSSIVYIAACLR